MAIASVAPTGTATGVKSSTAGTTFTITPITTVARNAIYVTISMNVLATTVSSISDGGTNTYNFIDGVTNGTIRTEIWKADKVNAGALAAATITVTLSASGSRAVGCVQTYSGVAFGDDSDGTNTGSSAAPTTAAQTLQETGDFLIGAIGVSSATALSAPTGTIEQQQTTTGLRGGLLDNTGATTETCAATSGNAAWAVVWVVIRVMSITADTLTMSEAPIVGYGDSIKDVLELTDADSTGVLTGIEVIEPNGFAHWQDNFRWLETGLVVLSNEYNVPIVDGFQRAKVTAVNSVVTATKEVWSEADTNQLIIVLTEVLSDTETANWSDIPLGLGWRVFDTITLADGTPVITNIWLVTIICPHLGQNWLDALTDIIGINEILSDTESANWLDALGVGYGNSESDTLTMSDFMAAGYGAATSDQLIITDSVGAGYGGLLSDTITFSDSLVDVIGFAVLLTDNEGNNWLDALGVGYGNRETDTLTMLDFTAAGYGSSTSDQLVISDSIGAGYGGLLSDQLILNESIGAGYGNLLADSLNNWLDAFAENLITAGLTLTLSDSESANWADFVAAGYGSATSDQIVIVDSVGAGYGGLLSDTLTLSDFAIDVLGFAIALTDNEGGNWSDFMAAGYGSAASDQIVIVDSISAGYGDLLSDQIIFQDGTPVVQNWWLLSIICPHLGQNWADAFAESFGSTPLTLTLSDDEGANWNDALGIGYGSAISETLTMSDFTGVGYGAGTSDQLVIVDSIGAGYGAQLTDSLNNWQDVFAENLQGTIISEQFSDNLNNWQDFTAIGYGSLTSDQLVISDSISSGYGALLSDTLSNWLDSLQEILTMLIMASDSETANWADAMKAGYGAVASDQLVIVDGMSAGYGASLSDSLNNWADALIEQLLTPGLLVLVLVDSETNNWADVLRIGYGNAETDTLTLADTVFAGYGSSTSDQIVLVDSLNSGYGSILNDSLNNWLDSESQVFGLIELISDTDVSWNDALGAGYGNAISDQLLLADFLTAGYGSGITDNLVLVDSVGAGYGAIFADDLNNWSDLLQTTLIGGFLALSLVDDNEVNWNDIFQTFLPLNTGPAFVYRVTTGVRVTIDPFINVLNPAIYRVLAQPKTQISFRPVPTSASLQFAFSEGLNNWQDFGVPQLSEIAFNLTDQLVLTDRIDAFFPQGMNLSDAGEVFIDDLSFVFTINTLILSVGDTLSFWAESLSALFPIGVALVDNQIAWTDTLSFTNNAALISLSVGDSGTVNWQNSLGSLMLPVPIFATVTDNLNNWADFIPSFSMPFLTSVVDSISNWADSTQFFATNQASIGDSLNNWFDSSVGFLNTILLTLSDSETNNWSDLFALNSPNGQLQIAKGENINLWGDTIGDGTGNKISDTLTVSDILQTGFGNVHSDTISFSDTVGMTGGLRNSLADQIVLSDFIKSGYGIAFTESVNNWADFVPGYTQAYNIGVIETLTLADAMAKTLQ